jgi:hypothetical protein
MVDWKEQNMARGHILQERTSRDRGRLDQPFFDTPLT